MANAGRKMAGMLAAATLTAATAASASVTSSADSPNARVRSSSAVMVALIERGARESATFRRLVDDVNASDGIVYVQGGRCLDDAPACFIGVSMAGSSRALWVRVNLKTSHSDGYVIGSIAHELRHTLEVLAIPSVTSTAAMQSLYRWAGRKGSAHGYETQAATDASGANEYVAMAARRQVRSRNATIARIILEAGELSKTFRNLVDIINTSNAIVYVEEGRCGGNVRTCLVTVTPAGPDRRILNVRVDIRKADVDLVGSIGHELYHVTEVLSYPSVTTGAAMLSLYRRIGYAIPGGAFETNDAIEAGDAVREEMREACARGQR